MPTQAVREAQVRDGDRCPACDRLLRQPVGVRWTAVTCACGPAPGDRDGRAVLMGVPTGPYMTITGLLAQRVDRNCVTCHGDGLVCEEHPARSWDSGLPSDCPCGAAGMPCRCTGLETGTS